MMKKIGIITAILVLFVSSSNAVLVKEGDRSVEVKWEKPTYNLNVMTLEPDETKPLFDLYHYNLFRRSIEGGQWIKLNSEIIPNYHNYYFDVNLINNRKYYYRITAIDYAGNESPPSVEVMGVPHRGKAPTRITNLRAWSNETGIVDLMWGEASDNENDIALYQIYRDLTEVEEEYLADIMRGRPSRYPPVVTLNKGQAVDGIFHYRDIGLPSGTVYYYAVTALDLEKNEAKASNTIGVKVFGIDIIPPFIQRVNHDAVGKPLKAGKVVMVTSEGEANNIATFDLVINPKTLDENVVKTSSGPIEKRPMQQTAQPGQYFGFETITSDFPNNNPIIPRVYYVDPAGNGAPMLGITSLAIIVDTVPPQKVSLISGKIDNYTVGLSWSDIEENIPGYRVYRSNNVITQGTLSNNTVISGKKLIKKDKKDSTGIFHFTDYNPVPSSIKHTQKYFYAVASVDEADNETITDNLEFVIPEIDSPPIIYSVSENTVGAAKKAGSKINITIKGEPGKKYEIDNQIYETRAYFAIRKNDTAIVDRTPISEILIGDRHTGTYEGEYQVKETDNVKDAEIVGFLAEPFGYYETSMLCTTLVTLVGTSSDTTAPQIDEIALNPVYTNYEGRDMSVYLTQDQKKFLVVGNELKITLKGEPGGVAYFDLGTMRRNIRMTEDTGNPGTYTGSYRVIQGDRMKPVNISCYLVDAAGNVANKSLYTDYKIDTIIIINLEKSRQEISTNETDPVDIRSSIVTATLKDKHNNALKEREIEFHVVGGYGDMQPVKVVTDSYGQAKSVYTGGYVVETGYIAVEDRATGYAGMTYVTTYKTGELNILLDAVIKKQTERTSNGKAYISLRAKPLRIEANGRSVSVITAFLGMISSESDNYDGVINDPYSEDYDPDPKKRDKPIVGQEVRFLIRDYVLDKEGKPKDDFSRPTYPGLPSASELDLKRGKIDVVQPLTDANGEAKAIYTSGTTTGLTIIQAIANLSFEEYGGPVGETIGVVLIAGGIRYLIIEARPIGTAEKPLNPPWTKEEGKAKDTKILADGKNMAQIRVTLLDSYENPVPEIKVEFKCDIGQIIEEGKGLTDDQGLVYATYTSPYLENGGTARVSAKVTSSNPLEEGLANFNLGNKYNIEGNFIEANASYNRAVQAFEATIAGYPYDDLLYPLVTKKWKLEDQERAYPDMIWNDDLLYMLGYTYELIESYEKAVRNYKDVVDYYFGGTWSDNADFRKGQVFEEQAELVQSKDERDAYIDKAVSSYEDLLDKFDTSAMADNALFQMGRIFEQKEFYPKAIEIYSKLIRDYPDSDLLNYSRYSIGICYEQLGDINSAVYAYQRVSGPFDDVIYKLAKEALARLGKD